jgi:hypothetical protein
MTLICGYLRLAYWANSTPDISPDKDTSVTSALSSGPVEATTSSAASAEVHSITSRPSSFSRSAKASR